MFSVYVLLNLKVISLPANDGTPSVVFLRAPNEKQATYVEYDFQNQSLLSVFPVFYYWTAAVSNVLHLVLPTHIVRSFIYLVLAVFTFFSPYGFCTF
jgi:hypothetical protein